jgi:flagellar hook protein FlgE
MGLTDALFTGTSGLRALGHGMSVIGDNVSNLNTTAFKGARITFSDIMAQSINTAAGSGQLGRGSGIQALYQLFTQGAFESTASPTDMAIAGAGFFMVKNPQTTGGIFYTRDGQFVIDKEGFLVNPQGLRVQGWKIDEVTNDITGALTDIRIDRSSPPVKTTKVDMITNLDARTEARSNVINLSGNLKDATGGGGTPVSNTFVIRDIDGKDNKIQVTLTWDVDIQKWSYEIRDVASGQILSSGTNVTSTRTTIELPSTKEQIILDWSSITHDSAAGNSLNIPGRTGRIEINGDTGWTTWHKEDFTVVDANGTSRDIRVWLQYDTTLQDGIIMFLKIQQMVLQSPLKKQEQFNLQKVKNQMRPISFSFLMEPLRGSISIGHPLIPLQLPMFYRNLLLSFLLGMPKKRCLFPLRPMPIVPLCLYMIPWEHLMKSPFILIQPQRTMCGKFL